MNTIPDNGIGMPDGTTELFFGFLSGTSTTATPEVANIRVYSFQPHNLPDIAEGFRQGFREFRKATREVTEELTGKDAEEVRANHPVSMAVTFILGAVCLILVAYEFSK